MIDFTCSRCASVSSMPRKPKSLGPPNPGPPGPPPCMRGPGPGGAWASASAPPLIRAAAKPAAINTRVFISNLRKRRRRYGPVVALSLQFDATSGRKLKADCEEVVKKLEENLSVSSCQLPVQNVA